MWRNLTSDVGSVVEPLVDRRLSYLEIRAQKVSVDKKRRCFEEAGSVCFVVSEADLVVIVLYDLWLMNEFNTFGLS